MKYEHQINWANAYNTNLRVDISISRLVRNGRIDLLSTLTLHPPEQMANSEVCTLYDRKNRTNSYNFLLITRVHALLHSVSFKSTFIDFALVIDILALSADFILPLSCVCVCGWVGVFSFLFRPYNRGMIEFNYLVNLFSTFFHFILSISTWRQFFPRGKA